MRYFFRVEYDGGAYHGWQRQPNGPTIQEALERAFTTVARQPCCVVGAGRTDAGVHACGQGAHVDLEGVKDVELLERSVNAVLPHDIAIRAMQHVPETFHAQYSAIARSYRYVVTCRKTPLLRARAWLVRYPVNWERVCGELSAVVGTHDFSAFRASGSSVEDPVCTVRCAQLERSGDERVFYFTADRFLYRMVRSLVGTVVQIGAGSRRGSLKEIMESRTRTLAGLTAPAHGLVLENVEYAEAVL